MSQAFVKEGDDNELLSHVKPVMSALLLYLKRQNNGREVYPTKTIFDPNGNEILSMSNGLSYMLNENNEWEMIF